MVDFGVISKLTAVARRGRKLYYGTVAESRAKVLVKALNEIGEPTAGRSSGDDALLVSAGEFPGWTEWADGNDAEDLMQRFILEDAVPDDFLLPES